MRWVWLLAVATSLCFGSDLSQVKLIPYFSHIQPGKPVTVGIEITIKDGRHTYHEQAGEVGYGTQINWKDKTIQSSPFQYPTPELIVYEGIASRGYHNRVILLTTITIPAGDTRDILSLKPEVHWLVCEKECVPITQDLAFDYPIMNSSPYQLRPIPDYSDAMVPSFSPETTTYPLWLMLGFAFLGGLILNLMPCVLPVLSIKVLSLLSHIEDKPLWHSVSYTIGIILSFVTLASILVASKLTGQSLGWGFQLQSPLFVTLMAWLFFLFALNLLGVFELAFSVGSSQPKQHSLKGSFFNGILATIVATPCTAPFMGTALGFSLTQPIWVSYAVFSSLGLGLAFPFLFLSLFPALLKWVPKPGNWMVTLKQFFAFPLFATALWLIWVLSHQIGASGIMIVLIGLLVIGFSVWLARHTKLGWVLLIAGLGVLSYVSFSPSVDKSPSWQPYSSELIDELTTQNKSYFIDFTAKWCLTCQLNKRSTLNKSEVLAAFKDADVTLIRADWTTKDDGITQAIQAYGRQGVPLYVLYQPKKSPRPEVLPEVLTPGLILEKVGK